RPCPRIGPRSPRGGSLWAALAMFEPGRAGGGVGVQEQPAPVSVLRHQQAKLAKRELKSLQINPLMPEGGAVLGVNVTGDIQPGVSVRNQPSIGTQEVVSQKLIERSHGADTERLVNPELAEADRPGQQKAVMPGEGGQLQQPVAFAFRRGGRLDFQPVTG